jgi:hypothetical protein
VKAAVYVISVTELQDALRDYMEKHGASQCENVVVDNGYGKMVLSVPLAPGSVVSGESFQRKTEDM